MAYYRDNDCTSGYASTQDHPELNFISVNKTIIPQHLGFIIHEGHVILQWDEATKAERFLVYRDGALIGNTSYTSFVDEDANPQHSYHYMVTGTNNFVESNPTNEVFVDWTTGLNETVDAQESILYPNPTSGQVFIESAGLQEVRVYNLIGQAVMHQTATDGQATLDMSSLPEGTYFVKLIGEQNEVRKVVKIQ